jgi:hypothetical protein
VAGHLGSHETLAKAVQAAGGLVCSKCLKKAVQAEAEAEAALNEQLAALMTEADPETEAGQAWLAAQQAADSEQQAAARAAAAARAEALGITAEAIAEHQAARAARQAAWTEQAEQQQQQQAEEQPAETPAAPALAIALTAEALTDYPTVHTFAISAMVYLDDRGYAVERTIRRNIARADLLQAFSRLVGQPQLSRLAAYADGCG